MQINSTSAIPRSAQGTYDRIAGWLSLYARAFNFKISSKEKENLKNFFRLMWHIDYLIDSQKKDKDRIRIKNEIIGRIIFRHYEFHFEDEIEILMKKLLEVLELQNSNIDFAGILKKAFTCSDDIREAKNVRELFDLTINEGNLTARLVPFFIYTKNEKFNKFLIRLGEVGNVVDTLRDFQSDWEHGLIKVPPTMKNLISFAWLTLVELVRNATNFLFKPRIFLISMSNVMSAFLRKRNERLSC